MFSKDFSDLISEVSANFTNQVNTSNDEKANTNSEKGEDEGNLLYWLSLSEKERMAALEKIRQQINERIYGTRQGFQRVYRITQRV